MEAPLLDRSSDGVRLIGDDGDYLPAKGLKAWWRIFYIESAKLWVIGGPIAFQIICESLIDSISAMFVGHLGTVELATFSIAHSVVTTFAYGFMLGMGSALETISGQAFGAGKIEMLGVYMQRSMIVLFVSCFILMPLYVFATPMLKLLGQQEDIADLARPYTLSIIPQLFSLSVSIPTQKFLQAQSKVYMLAWITFLSLLSQFFLCWLFINVYHWGIAGAAVAYDITNWGVAIGQYIYVVGWCKDGWKGYSWLAFSDMWEFVKLSLASAVMQSLEMWYSMSIIVLAGNLNNSVTAIDSLSICLNVNTWELMLFIGVNAAVSVRVSNELGSAHPRATKYSVYITVLQSLVIGILCMTTVVATRDHFAIIFTDSKEMQRAVSHLSGLLAITMLLNSVQPVISGVAVGGGWQALVAYINLGCYYIFGVPLGYVLGYIAEKGVMGLWGGMVAGMALQTLILIVILHRTNWKQEVENATNRLSAWGGRHSD